MRKHFWLAATIMLGMLTVFGFSQVRDAETLRREAERLQTEGNWKNALDRWRQLATDANTPDNQAASDLLAALQCQNQLGLQSDVDDLLQKTIEAHPRSWRVLENAARMLHQSPHYGMVIDQKFKRNPQRNTSGRWINASEQDRQQALQWLVKSLELSDNGDATNLDRARINLQLADTLLESRSDRFAWRLQETTDLTKSPDFLDMEAPNALSARYASVDADGKPVYHALPASWDAAKSDGQRFRWVIAQTIELDTALGHQAELRWAEFLHSQFSVDTLAEQMWLMRSITEDAAKKDGNDPGAGITAIHTLGEDETIARLANGIRRFQLPDEFNPIRVYQRLASRQVAYPGSDGLQHLANTFLNRRQFPKAVEMLRETIGRFRDLDGNMQSQIDNIVQARGMFDPVPSQVAGEPNRIGFVFRNAKHAKFSAVKVDLEKLLLDQKNFYRNPRSTTNPSFGGRAGTHPPQIESPAELFNEKTIQNYVGREVASWTLTLEPRENHWDRRIDVETPLRDAGLFVVTVSLDNDQHTARCLMWIQDTAVVRKMLDKKVMYVVADAKSGKPLTNMNVEFFGFGYENNNARRQPQNWTTKNFAKKTDAQGQLLVPVSELDANFQWSVAARDSQGRLGLLGFQGIWNAVYDRQNFQQLKAYGVSDRPAYRPGDTIKAKFWLARANYALNVASTPISERPAKIELMDPQGKVFWERTQQTDSFGGTEIEIPLPKGASLGAYRFRVLSANQHLPTELFVRVEEYRKPEFEVTIQSPSTPIALGESFKARVQAKYYFGTPVAEGTAHIKVERTAFTDRYYPIAPYDWCYGPGYWWFAYDYAWYPGWQKWAGCVRPAPWWMPNFGFEPPELVLEQDVALDGNGEAAIEIDTALAKAIQGDQDHRYKITAEVRDASRRTIASSGEVIAARQAFKVYSWTDRGYYRVGNRITANFQARTLDGKPVAAKGTLQLMRITYEDPATPKETPVQEWSVTSDNDGRLTQVLQADRSGQYRLRLRLTDAAGHEVEGGYIFTVRGQTDSAGDFRYDALELIPDRQQYKPGEKVQLQINANRADARVLLFVRPSNGVYLEPRIVQLQAKSTTVEIDVQAADQPNFFVEAVAIYDGRAHTAVREIIVPPEDRVLDVKLTADKKDYLPGEEAKVDILVTAPDGKPVVGSTVLAVYDRALEQIARDALPGDIREFFWKWRRHHNSQQLDNLSWETYQVYLQNIQAWSALGLFGQTLADDAEELGVTSVRKLSQLGKNQIRKPNAMRFNAPSGPGGAVGGMGASRALMMDGAAAPLAAAAEGIDVFATEGQAAGAPGADNASQQVAATVRKDFADSALWLAKITTDNQGRATAKFKMPENLTSWQIRSWSVGSGVRVGSATTEAVTRKNLLVRLQTPRFLVERDEVILSAIVHNDLNTAKDVRVSLEIDGQTQLERFPDSQESQTVRIESHGQARIDWRCKALAEGTVTLRAIATTDVESDAMQLKTPILVNGILKTDSLAGTVRADQAKSMANLKVPNERRAEHSRLVVNLSPSLAAAMIDALPYLADYPHGCTEQTLNRFLPTVITQKVLRNMQIDLASLAKTRNNLNAQELGDPTLRRGQWQRFGHNPVYEAAEVDLMVESGLRKLSEMQLADGGWGWFSGFGEQSYPHTTAIIVRGLLTARDNDVAIVPDVLARGMAWLEAYQLAELQKLKNAASETKPYKLQPDSIDALVFHILVRENRVNAEMQTFLYEKRAALGGYGQALLALATHKLGNATQTNMLRQNIEQFLVEDAENETAYLRDNSPWWYWYGSQIEASAMYLKLLSATEPKGRVAPRLVKYLLNNRKHATYWSSTRDTALVIEAFADYIKASGETKASVTAEVWLDDKRLGSVSFTPANMFSVDNKISISGNAVPAGEHRLEIRRTGDGPIYWNAYLTNFTLEEEIAASGLEVKVERRFYRLDPTQKDLTLAGDRGQVIDAKRSGFDRIPLEDLQALKSGTLVEVELLVESKNDYEYLLLEDRKPAGLETVDTQSGFMWNSGIGVYRELRDQTTSFFIRHLPRGQHSLRYQLRAEAPGVFTALPAQIAGMYAPELTGNSSDFDLKVID